MKIFICEQDPYRAKLIQDVLGVYNYNIVTVKRQSDFFKEAHLQKPSVIIMNEVFAGQSDNNILARLRKDPATSHVPVIYIGNASALGVNSSNIGYDRLIEILQEPFKIKNLRHYIDRWTTLRSLYIKH